ncbi:MAG: hypothetical protein SFY32_06665 [Bacteroidota bacterium]|nr:hypothetical protein [Bacteroidota bacterium]
MYTFAQPQLIDRNITNNGAVIRTLTGWHFNGPATISGNATYRSNAFVGGVLNAQGGLNVSGGIIQNGQLLNTTILGLWSTNGINIKYIPAGTVLMPSISVSGVSRLGNLQFADGTGTSTWMPVITSTSAISQLQITNSQLTNSVIGLNSALTTYNSSLITSINGLNTTISVNNSQLTNSITGLSSSLTNSIIGINSTLTSAINQINSKPATWSTQGNTITGYEFIGTTNYQPLYLRTNGITGITIYPYGRVDVPNLFTTNIVNANTGSFGSAQINGDLQVSGNIVQNGQSYNISNLDLWSNGGFTDPNTNTDLGQLSNVWKQKLMLMADVTEIPGAISAWSGLSVGGRNKYSQGGPDLINGLPAYGIGMNAATGIVQVAGYNGVDIVDGTGSVVSVKNGKVGIGVANPSKKLDVVGDVNISGDLYKNGTKIDFQFNKFIDVQDSPISSVSFDVSCDADGATSYGIHTTRNTTFRLLNSSTQNQSYCGGDVYTHNVVFDINGEALAKKLTVNKGGYYQNEVLLDVNGGINGYNISANNLNITSNADIVGNITTRDILFRNTNGDPTSLRTQLSYSWQTDNSFYRVDANTQSIKQNLYFKPSTQNAIGNVGIGTTAPGYKLEVVGSIKANDFYDINGLKIISSPWIESNHTQGKRVTFAGDVVISGTGNYLQFPDGSTLNSAQWRTESIYTGSCHNNPNTLAQWYSPICTLSFDQSKVKTILKPYYPYEIRNYDNSLIGGGSSSSANIWLINGTAAYYNSGRVGIGTSTPAAPLHVADNGQEAIRAEGRFHSIGQYNDGGMWCGAGTGNEANSRFVGSLGNGIGFWTRDANSLGTRLLVKDNGQVVIGAANGNSATDAKLAVYGTIYSTKSVVTQNGWSDFVFANDYKLMTLAETEKYIAQNKKLPGIPSEKEITEKGLDTGEMLKLHMQKIEELTLHLIRLEKENETLKQEVLKLK